MIEQFVHYAAGGGDGLSCPACNAHIPEDRIGKGTCGKEECHDRMIQESARAIKARKRAKHDKVSAGVFAQTSAEIDQARAGLDNAAPTCMVPAQNEPLGPLPAERLALFRQHLDECATMAFDKPDPDTDLARREAEEPDKAPLTGAACATCQGRCCRDRGGNTALLLSSDLERYRRHYPGVTKEQAIDAYLSHLPRTSTRDGCVYLAATGCSLPRDMRPDICNSYYCDSLRWLREAVTKSGVDQAVVVAAHEGVPERVAAVASGGVRAQIADFTKAVE